MNRPETTFKTLLNLYMREHCGYSVMELSEATGLTQAEVTDDLAQLDPAKLFRFRGKVSPSHDALCEPYMERAMKEDLK